MRVEKIDIDRFLDLSNKLPILDVRSHGEFSHAHIPGSYSVPIFTDEQRAIIGAAYVQQSRQVAVDYGLNYFSDRMKEIPGEISKIIERGQRNEIFSSYPASEGTGFLVHCWRGGMRSEAVAWLLSLYGYKIYILSGGYKAFRRWVLSQFEKQYSLKVLGGFTGSGKTEVLKELKGNGKTVINLEELANHKGSAFGALGEQPQPSHEMFENLLAINLWKVFNNREYEPNDIWIEDESVHIGRVGIPKIFWQQMRQSPLCFLDVPFDERLNYITRTYGIFDKEELNESILKIQKRLGGLNTKNAIHFLSENKFREAFAILLAYYDKMYERGLYNRENILSLLNKVTCSNVTVTNAKKLDSL